MYTEHNRLLLLFHFPPLRELDPIHRIITFNTILHRSYYTGLLLFFVSFCFALEDMLARLWTSANVPSLMFLSCSSRLSETLLH